MLPSLARSVPSLACSVPSLARAVPSLAWSLPDPPSVFYTSFFYLLFFLPQFLTRTFKKLAKLKILRFIREPKAESRKPKAESREPRAVVI